MKQIKSILTILILAISVAGVAPTAMAQKEPIKTCAQCKKSYKASQFPGGSSICSSCVAKNKAKKDAEKKAQEEAKKKAQEKARKEAEKREAERKEAERREAERREAEKREAKKREAERKEAERREAERKEAERRETEKREAEKREAEKREAERLAELKKAEQEKIINDYINNMVYVEGGTFKMGATRETRDQRSDAVYAPPHRVTLSSFYIGQTEVTQELWLAVMGENPSWFNGYGNSKYYSNHNENYGTNLRRPVEYVSWDECQEFICKLNEKTGKNFRLPTEAEWEYAARGGNKSQGYKYSGSNNIDDVAWYNIISSRDSTHQVATKRANELGIYDMSGNVCEWCSDWYGKDYYNNSPSSNPQGPTSGSFRVIRGGGCYDVGTRVSYRHYEAPGCRSNIGFRLAL